MCKRLRFEGKMVFHHQESKFTPRENGFTILYKPNNVKLKIDENSFLGKILQNVLCPTKRNIVKQLEKYRCLYSRIAGNYFLTSIIGSYTKHKHELLNREYMYNLCSMISRLYVGLEIPKLQVLLL